jgi:carbon-monoxide dehydrogenase small subunit
MRIHVTVNGSERDVETASNTTVLDFLREGLRLTGTKECCDLGECGACTVLVGGRAVNACLVLAGESDGTEITTIEGLAAEGKLSTLQDAFLAAGAVQCGFCIPGQVMAAQHLLERIPHPTIEEVREGLSGNLCRCGGYLQICEAVVAAGQSHP